MSTISKYIITVAAIALVLANISLAEVTAEYDFENFYQALRTETDEQALKIGEKMFEKIERKYRADTGFGVLKSKMIAAEFLANQMITQLKTATGKQMFNIAGKLFEVKAKSKNNNSLSVAPAKSFYESSLKVFKNSAGSAKLEDEEKKFLSKFYDLKLRILTSEIARADKALTVAEPSFKGTYDYVLVLPLLHASEDQPVNIDVLPKWMRKSSQLDVFSDSCLLHFGFAYHAQTFAAKAAELEGNVFTQEAFYRSASEKCAKQLPRVAVDCLERAINSISEKNLEEKIDLQFDIVQVWLDSENFSLAAGKAKEISDNFGDNKRAGDAIWLYFYALSRANNGDTILANIDSAISDPRCTDYRAKLMYMKWWALRRKKDNAASIAAIEHQLITDYSDDFMVAPIMLSRATDLLAGQDYKNAFALLVQIQEKFPSTSASKQAKKMAEKIKAMQSLK